MLTTLSDSSGMLGCKDQTGSVLHRQNEYWNRKQPPSKMFFKMVFWLMQHTVLLPTKAVSDQDIPCFSLEILQAGWSSMRKGKGLS